MPNCLLPLRKLSLYYSWYFEGIDVSDENEECESIFKGRKYKIGSIFQKVN